MTPGCRRAHLGLIGALTLILPVAAQAQQANPHSVAVDAAGNVYFSDRADNSIFRIDGAGTLGRIAGVPVVGAQPHPAQGIAVDSAGNLYFADANQIRKATPDGTITTVAGTEAGSGEALALPAGLAVDRAGNLFIADSGNHRIRKVAPDGIVTTVAGTGIQGYGGDGDSAIHAQIAYPAGVAVDNEGNLFIADAGNNRIRKVSAAGVITTAAGTGVYGYFGDGGPAVNAQFKTPGAVAVDGEGNLFVADRYNHRIRKVAPDGTITSLAGKARLRTPSGVAVDPAGNLYIADSNSGRILRLTATNIITSISTDAGPVHAILSRTDRNPAPVNGIQCTVNSGVPPNIRAEGLAELSGDIMLICTGGTPIDAGTILPQMSLTVVFNTQVTSRLLGDASEAFLTIDEPTAAQAKVCVPGIANPGAPTDPNYCPVVGTGGSATEFKSGNANMIRGTVAGNSVVFAGVPIDPTGILSTRVYRIINVRVNATIIAPGGPGIPGQVLGLLSATASPGSPTIAINNPTQITAFVQTGLITGIRTADDSGPLTTPTTFQQCASVTPTKVANLVFTEGFTTALKIRTTSSTAASGVTPQNTIGLVYNAESGYYNPSLAGSAGLAGLADFGTRLKAVFNNIPAGVILYTSTQVTSQGGTPGIGPGKNQANLTATETDAYSPVSSTQTLDGIPAAALTSLDGSATAIWELVGANPLLNESYHFPLWIGFAGASSGTATVNSSFAPTPPAFSAAAGAVAQDATVPIPRFVDTSTASSIFQITSCNSTMPVTIGSNPAGRTVLIDGTAFTAPATVNWSAGSSHSIAAISPSAAGTGTRYAFASWDDGGAQSHSITAPSSPATYTATFGIQYLLTTAASPANGGILANPTSSDGYYNSGATVQLTALPAAGFQFANWSGDLTGAANPQSVVLNAPRSVTANFTGGCVYSLAANAAPAVVAASTGSFNVIGTSGCFWTATSGAAWVTITSGASGTGNGTVSYSVAANSGAARTGTITAAGQAFTITQAGIAPPTPASVTPASGNAGTQAMTFTFTDPRGWQDLGVLNILINNFLDGRHACYLAYVQSANLLLLVDDAGDAGGPFIGQMVVDGSAGSMENSQCKIDGTGSSRFGSGNNLTLTLNVTFKPGLAGNRIVYMAARDQAENNSGWQASGVWQAPGSPAGVIAAASVSPARVTGAGQQQYTFTVTDSKGAADIGIVNVLTNDFIDGRHGCYLAYIAQSKLLVLVDDAGDAGGPFAGSLTLGDPGTIANGQCTVGLVSATASGNTMTLTLSISYASSFSGNRIMFVAARDPLGANNTDWQALGTWGMQ